MYTVPGIVCSAPFLVPSTATFVFREHIRCIHSSKITYKIFRQKGLFVYLISANNIQEAICNHDSTERLIESLFVFIAEIPELWTLFAFLNKTFFHFFPSSSFLSAAACIIFYQLDLNDGQI